MLDKDHTLVSEAVCLGYAVAVHDNSVNIVLPSVLGVFIGCQLPDIDSDASKINHFTRPFSKIISYFGHRGITHSLWAIISMFLLVKYVLYGNPYPMMIFHSAWNYFCLWLLFGYILHIIEDWFSTGGVIWFFPIGHYRRWIPPSEHKKPKRKRRPTYIRTRITKWFRYESTVIGKKGRYERWIRRLSILIIIIEIVMMAIY